MEWQQSSSSPGMGVFLCWWQGKFCILLKPLLGFFNEGALKKIDQMWSEYHFFIFSRILVQINAKEFSENPWETLGFSRTILLGNLARSREYKQYRKQKQRQQKGDEKRTRYEVTKIAPSAFSQESYLFWEGEWGFRSRRVGESQTWFVYRPGRVTLSN